jgi:multisubunit Na+/H+ antiporter MnhG subunit
MKSLVADILLALATAAIWLGCLGFVRLRAPLDRLHAATFAGVVAGPLILLAGVVGIGLTSAMLKLLFIVVVMLLGGGVLSHGIGRAIAWRDRHGAGSA